jgi:predicted nucleic acid-binding protein
MILKRSYSVAERPAVNASPLIYLVRAGLLDLLQLLGSEIVLPLAVAAEIQQRGQSDPAVQALNQTAWLSLVQTPPVPASIQAWGLGLGESSVLAWAHANPGTEVIIDDLAARRCAAALSIPVRGTLGLVLTAKQRGQIPAARPLLLQLRQAGMYLSDRVLNQALALIGE